MAGSWKKMLPKKQTESCKPQKSKVNFKRKNIIAMKVLSFEPLFKTG